jgi:hypothetical protein
VWPSIVGANMVDSTFQLRTVERAVIVVRLQRSE